MTVILPTGIQDRGAVLDDKYGAVAALGSEVCMTASTLQGPRGRGFTKIVADAVAWCLLGVPSLLFLSKK